MQNKSVQEYMSVIHVPNNGRGHMQNFTLWELSTLDIYIFMQKKKNIVL